MHPVIYADVEITEKARMSHFTGWLPSVLVSPADSYLLM